MRATLCLFLIATAAAAEDLTLTRLAGVTFKVADLEKSRQFYTGMLGLEEAFTLQDSTGQARSVFFKVNDEQYLEFSPGAAENFSMEHISMLTPDVKKAGAMLGVAPARSADGNSYVAIKQPGQTGIHLVQYMPGGKQAGLRGKALGERRISEHLQHAGLPADDEAAFMTLYRDKLGLRELFRGGPVEGETRWINRG